MLTHLTVSDYAIVQAVSVDLSAGMTVISGETGAGKSIMLDALALCLGDRADASSVRHGAQRAEISACFDISNNNQAQIWLKDRALDHDGECILRRVISAEGRSRAFINGVPSNLTDCAQIGAMLVDLHSQHEHQSLLRRDVQRSLLDAFAGCADLAQEVADLAAQWRDIHRRHSRMSQNGEEEEARKALLTYQLDELNTLGITEGEVADLEGEQKLLANATFLIEQSNVINELLDLHGDGLRTALQKLDDSRFPDNNIASARELLNSASIQVQEAVSDLSRFADTIDIDPGRLNQVERRLDEVYTLARKHRVDASELHLQQQHIEEALVELEGDEASLNALAQQMTELAATWQLKATKLSQIRHRGAIELAEKATSLLEELAMAQCHIDIALTPLEAKELDARGSEDVHFLLSTNPGAPAGPLSKVASGGELSRISLALQVIAAQSATSPTMIFDEVDVGVGGAVAEVVGTLLRNLSTHVQVICVTHLPQVAAQGLHHLRVEKQGKNAFGSHLSLLDNEGRIDEIARMLGGKVITEKTRAHAKEMLALA
jgi:DNA repair protein RecN (Recombination protein N)